MNYSEYTAKDFILDDFFKGWVTGNDPAVEEFWKKWLEDHPEKMPEIEEARSFILRMRFRNHLLAKEELVGDWNKLSREIDQYENDEQTTIDLTRETTSFDEKESLTTAKRFALSGWAGIAASLTGLLLVTLVYFWYIQRTEATIATGYGETRQVTLPDQSVITLNANSQIKYKKDWNASENREVWLEGEAFFKVVHTQNHQKFIVHTIRNMDVEVLGTEFNIFQRKSGTRVVLSSGKVKLNIRKENREQQVAMIPGEMVELTESPQGFVKKVVNPALFSAWVDKHLIFKNTSVREIAALLEDTYGVNVEIRDTNLLNQEISGRVPSNNLESLLFALSESLNCQISKQEDEIIFQPKTIK